MFAAGLACAVAGDDQPATPGPNVLTLEDSIHLALTTNPQLGVSGARVDAAMGRAYQAGRWSNPELELSAEEWPVSGGGGFSDAKQTIGIVQRLPFPGKKSLDKRIGGAGVQVSEAGLALRRTELVRNVKAAFFNVLAAERMVEVSQQLVAVAESSAVTARKRVDAGAAAYQEQLRAEVQLEQARTAWMERDLDLATARERFATILGQPERRDATLQGRLAETLDSIVDHAFTEERLTNHPSLLTAQANLDQAQLRVRRARLDPYPDVGVRVAGGRIGETDESIIELGFSVPLPLLDGGRGNRQAAQADVVGAEADLLATRQELNREWANAMKRYRTAVNQVGNYRERILPKAEEALTLVQIGFEEGKFDFIDLLDTQRTTAEARQAYQYRLLEMNIAHAELEALLRPQTIQSPTNN
jgi:cobalt-zinc-cadmium efflux system outer membrane protein